MPLPTMYGISPSAIDGSFDRVSTVPPNIKGIKPVTFLFGGTQAAYL